MLLKWSVRPRLRTFLTSSLKPRPDLTQSDPARPQVGVQWLGVCVQPRSSKTARSRLLQPENTHFRLHLPFNNIILLL